MYHLLIEINFANMNKISVLIIITLSLTTASACTVFDSNESNRIICSNAWYTVVEEQIPTGDGQGHGPDLGSMEWRSVIKFKLGIRGDKNNPALASEQWCQYIDVNYIK